MNKKEAKTIALKLAIEYLEERDLFPYDPLGHSDYAPSEQADIQDAIYDLLDKLRRRLKRRVLNKVLSVWC